MSVSGVMSVDTGGSEPDANQPPFSFGSFPALIDAARQQTELVCWVAKRLQDHDEKLQKLLDQAAQGGGGGGGTRWSVEGSGQVGWQNFKSMREDKPRGSVLNVVSAHLTAKKLKTQGTLNNVEALGPTPETPPPEQRRDSGVSAAHQAQARPMSTEFVDRSPSYDFGGDSERNTVQEMAPRQQSPSEEVEEGRAASTQAHLQALQALSQEVDHLSEDVDRRLEEFARFMNEELQRAAATLQGAVTEQVRASVAAQLEGELPRRMAKLSDEVKRAVDEKFSNRVLEEVATGLSLEDGKEASGGAVVDSEMLTAMKFLHADVNRRLPVLEDCVAEVREMRLQIPDMQDDLEVLKQAVAQLTSAMEKADSDGEEEEGSGLADLPEESASLGAVQLDARSPSPPRRTSRASSSLAAPPVLFATPGAATAPTSPMSPPPGAGPVDLGRRRSTRLLGGIAGYVNQQRNPQLEKDIEETKGAVEGMKERMESLEHEVMPSTAAKCADLEQLVAVLEDRLKELDTEFRSRNRKVEIKLDLLAGKLEQEREEDMKHHRTWNLANQVDVIQTLVQSEMRHVRNTVEHLINKKMLGEMPAQRNTPGRETERSGPSPPLRRRSTFTEKGNRSRSNSPTSESTLAKLQDAEDKIKRLQECFQQCTLKIAGLKSANKHYETQMQTATEQIKKIFSELEVMADVTTRQECRMDYIALHAGGASGATGSVAGDATTFAAAVAAGTVVASPSLHGTRRGLGSTLNMPKMSLGRRTLLGGMASPVQSAALAGPGLSEPNSPDRKPRRGSALTPSSGASLLLGMQMPPPTFDRQTSDIAGVVGVAGEDPSSPGGVGHTLSTGRAQALQMEVEVNTGRIVRLGKKVSDLDTEFAEKFQQLREDLEYQSQQISQVVAFLPRKQRRIVERLLASYKAGTEKEEAPVEEEKRENKEGRRHVGWTEKIETKSYQVVEDSILPWQLVGEPDQKWSWCYQNLNEMGRELARHLEQEEHEREEFENEVNQKLEMLQEELARRPAAGGPAGRPGRNVSSRAAMGDDEWRQHPPSPDDLASEPLSPGGADRLGRRIERAIVPQIASLEDRLERLAGEVREAKRLQEIANAKKVDKEEFTLVAMRISLFDKMEPKILEARLEALEGTAKYYENILEQLAQQIRNVEDAAAHRGDVTKVRGEVSAVKAELGQMSNDLKDMTSSIYNTNRHMTHSLTEMRGRLDKEVSRLQDEKLGMKDFTELVDRVHKMEYSMKDNRQLLSDGSNQEVNSVIKRIVLNMEDKIMIIEKKLDALIEKSHEAAELSAIASAADPASPSNSPSRLHHPAGEAAAVQALGAEVQNLSQALLQLRQDIQLSKVDIEQIQEQGHQHVELAQRLNVLVEGAAADDGETGGTTLSLSRVQVMVSAAARQLVAGSKWITKETFDLRFAEMRKEYMHTSRQLQQQLDEMATALVRVGAPSIASGIGGSANPSTARLPKMLVRRADQAEILEWPEALGDRVLDKAAGRASTGGPPKDRPGTTTGVPSSAGVGGPGIRGASPRNPVRPGTRG